MPCSVSGQCIALKFKVAHGSDGASLLLRQVRGERAYNDKRGTSVKRDSLGASGQTTNALNNRENTNREQ